MPKRPPFLRGRTLCIFCEGASGASISHEHVLPDWLNEVFPRDPATVHTLGTTSWVGLSPGAPVTKRYRKRGHVTTRQVRVVCEKCNNGWLSGLEDRTKPVLLCASQRRAVRPWPGRATASCHMGSKNLHDGRVHRSLQDAIPQGDRTFLRHTLSPAEVKTEETGADGKEQQAANPERCGLQIDNLGGFRGDWREV